MNKLNLIEELKKYHGFDDGEFLGSYIRTDGNNLYFHEDSFCKGIIISIYNINFLINKYNFLKEITRNIIIKDILNG